MEQNDEKNLFRRIAAIVLICALAVACISMDNENVYARAKPGSKTLYTQLLQKTNPAYDINIKNGSAVVYKVRLKKSKIVVYGTLYNFITRDITKNGKHTYRLSNKAKFFSRGGEASDTEYSKQDFKSLLDRCKDSGLSLSLTLKKGKVIEVAVSS